MFFKKKPKVESAPNLFPLFIEIATELYHSVATTNEQKLSGVLSFDDQQRISGIKNLTLDGYPKVPPAEFVEKINGLTRSLKSLPAIYKIKTLTVSVEDGQVNADAEYME